MRKKTGFSLAEILIALVVIGIVATITLTILNNSTNNEQFKSAIYKNASILNNAIRRCYAFSGNKIDWFQDANDLKTNFFMQHFNIINLDTKDSNNWPEGIQAETSFYLDDGAKYGISEKITDSCEYNTKNKEENIPCYFIYVDTNGDKKPNKKTTIKGFYNDINVFYAYSDRFILEPGGIEYIDNDNKPDDNKPEEDDTTPAPDNDENKPDENEPEEDDNNDDKPKMERCLDKKSYEECVKFCEKNGYHSALCK